MKRGKKILYISHCLLNQNTIAPTLVKKGWTSGVWELTRLCEKYDVGLEQMPCPEFDVKGYPRCLATKDDYETEEFRDYCKKLSEEVEKNIRKFEKAGFKVLGVVGVAGSPSCGVFETHRKNVEGRVKESGIFMEELKKIVKKPFTDFDYKKPELSLKKLEAICLHGPKNEND